MKYKVLIETLNHDGRKRQPGELIDMSEADAAPLLKVGAVEVAAAVTTNPPPPDPGPDGAINDNPGQPTVAQSGSTDTSGSTVQKQPVISASDNSGVGSGDPKSGKKDGKTKAE